MVEMGDMREGILPRDLVAIARRVLMMPGIVLKGIGANFACLSAITPAAATMAAFSALANDVERACGPFARTVSGGNSANVPWALGPRPPGRINDLRLGEAILLGIDPVSGKRIGSLATDAFTLVAEVIETKVKPEPILMLAVDPALRHLQPAPDAHHDARSILAIGQQDTDISGLTPPPGVTFMGATSDHLVVVAANSRLPVGSEMRFQVNYSALMQAMNAVDVVQVMHNGSPSPDMNAAGCSRASLALA